MPTSTTTRPSYLALQLEGPSASASVEPSDEELHLLLHRCLDDVELLDLGDVELPCSLPFMFLFQAHLTGPRLCTSHRVPPLEVPEAHLRRGIRHGSNNAQFAARGAHPVRAEEVIALASEHVEAVWKTTTIEKKVSPSARGRCGHGSLLRGNDRRLGASHRMHLCSTPSHLRRSRCQAAPRRRKNLEEADGQVPVAFCLIPLRGSSRSTWSRHLG